MKLNAEIAVSYDSQRNTVEFYGLWLNGNSNPELWASISKSLVFMSPQIQIEHDGRKHFLSSEVMNDLIQNGYIKNVDPKNCFPVYHLTKKGQQSLKFWNQNTGEVADFTIADLLQAVKNQDQQQLASMQKQVMQAL